MADQNTTPTPAPQGGNPAAKVTPETIAAAIAVLTAAANQPQQQADASAKEKQEAVERASKIEALDAEIKVLGDKKKAECLALLPLIHKHFAGQITLANGAVVYVRVDAQKRPTKKGITSYCVEKLKEQGEAFAKGLWASIKATTRQGISVRRVGEPTVPDGETEGPTEE